MHDEADTKTITVRASAGDNAAQAQLGLRLFQTGQIQEALPWIEKAAAAEQVLALNLLGVMHLNGVAVPLDMRRAATLLSRASELGLREANYTLAGMHAAGFGVTADPRRAWQFLIRACRSGHPPALRAAGVLYLIARPGDMNGVRLLRIAAERADGLAQAMLAVWLAQNGSAQELAEARYWLDQSGAHSRISGHLKPDLPPAGVAPDRPMGEPDWERLEPVIPPTEPAGKSQTLIKNVVYEIHDALPYLACEYLITLSAPRLKPSMVVDPQTGRQAVNPVRSSHSMYLPPNMCDCVVSYVSGLMARLAELPATHSEPISILHYSPGQEYKPHQDYFVGTAAGDTRIEQQGGQRKVTVFTYLSEVQEGGETDFPELHLRIRPARGKAVKFMNLDADDMPNPMTLHAGRPVIQGEKWLATFWFRQRPFVWEI